jgi:hypothetical protein
MTTRKKQPFPPEADTQPERTPLKSPRASGPAPKTKRDRAGAPTEPPPPLPRARRAGPKPNDTRSSGVQSKRPRRGADGGGSDRGGARIDEVTADLSRDPRRERDDD